MNLIWAIASPFSIGREAAFMGIRAESPLRSFAKIAIRTLSNVGTQSGPERFADAYPEHHQSVGLVRAEPDLGRKSSKRV